MDADVEDVPQLARTGPVPETSWLEDRLEQAHAYALEHHEGEVATYIPALARADPDEFGICVADVRGELHEVGDSRRPFSIQSISKAFVYALLCDAVGHRPARDVVGVNATGASFDSIVAIELNDGHPGNPMVNAGALATTALLPAGKSSDRWDTIVRGLSAFAGRTLEVDEEVYASESGSNHRNRAIAELLVSHGRITADPREVVDVYSRQCSLLVDARDLGVMAATLADGGVNPLTRERVVSDVVARDTLAVMASTGLYELSGEWLFDVGLPGKSGVSGGLATIAPGKVGIGTFAPPLDAAGTSVRGQIATAHLARSLGLHIFASSPHSTPGGSA